MDLCCVTWRKSSYSAPNGGNCVEVGLAWRKSSYSASNGGDCVEVGMAWCKSSYSGSNGGGCVEVAQGELAGVAVRDSKDPAGPALTFSPAAWRTFMSEIKAGPVGPR